MAPRLLVLVSVLAATLPGPAFGSQLVGRNVSVPGLAVDAAGKRAIVTFRENGRARRVLIWGAVNARHLVTWEAPGLPDYDSANGEHVQPEREMNALLRRIAADDPFCREHL